VVSYILKVLRLGIFSAKEARVNLKTRSYLRKKTYWSGNRGDPRAFEDGIPGGKVVAEF
jgi:hypothetical protein